MGTIDAVMQYNKDGLPWSYRMETMWRLAACPGVILRSERRPPVGDPEYYSVTVTADEMQSIRRFIISLFAYIGVADSPIIFVYAKKRRAPGFSKRLVAPISSAAEVDC